MMGELVMRRAKAAAMAVALGGMLLGTSAVVQAEENQFARDFGMGLGASGANLLYMPTKIVYATLGGVTGGFAYALTGGNLDAARKVWTPSMGGTYVVTPTMLLGEEKVMFSGTTEPKRTEVALSGGQQLVPSSIESAPPVPVETGSDESFKGY